MAPGATIQALRSHEGRPAVAINWRYFGSAGYESVPAGLVTERFVRANALVNDHVKVIAQPAEIFRRRNSDNFYYRLGRLGVTPDGRRVYGSFAAPSERPLLVLHHYVYRSRQDYEQKMRGGFVDARGAKDEGRHISRAQVEFHNHNDVSVAIPAETLRATAEVLQVSDSRRSLRRLLTGPNRLRASSRLHRSAGITPTHHAGRHVTEDRASRTNHGTAANGHPGAHEDVCGNPHLGLNSDLATCNWKVVTRVVMLTGAQDRRAGTPPRQRQSRSPQGCTELRGLQPTRGPQWIPSMGT